LTRFSEYEADQTTQRHPLLYSGGPEKVPKGTAFIQEEEDHFVTDGPAIEKGESDGTGRECIRSLERVVQSENCYSPWTLSSERGRRGAQPEDSG
jgi:hypothetical protein